MEIYFFLGFLAVAGLCGLVVALLARQIKKGGASPEYDERQTLGRLQAYRSAFWTVVAYLVLNGIYEMVEAPWADGMMMGFIGICLGVMVFAVSCVWKDAYFALNKKPKAYVGLFVGMALLNGGIAAMNAAQGYAFVTEDGLLTFRCLNVVVLIMFAVLALAVGIKAMSRGANRGEEE